ncbi:hypothetical protein CHH26_00965 [Qipengyuania flava]|uniref:hypothetical protein n=1 Tax=Qipengyuania flava TaxID=192812 RepID=UPI000B8BC261|nr:hypothetical protein [Qipengyuania flava]ASP28993.1 hypothetical protein CHH26_00965 [Qipengyuania flava]
MTIGILFILGVANFALHRAMLDSDHPLLASLPPALRANGGRLSLAFEFLILLLAMLLAVNGWPSAAWVYGLYTLINAGTAWVLLGGSD